MKQTLGIIAPLLLTAVAAVLASCSGGGGKQADTNLPADTVAEVADSVPSGCTYTLRADSIGPVRVGMDSESWPAEVAGLYDTVEAQPGGDADSWNFYLDGNCLFTALDFGEGHVDLICLGSPEVKASASGGDVSLSTPFSEIASMEGMRSEWLEVDDMGMWYWTDGRLWYAPAQEHLPEELVNLLYSPDRAPTAADFGPGTVTGYIGTGLPF